jgi:hypothetical protein
MIPTLRLHGACGRRRRRPQAIGSLQKARLAVTRYKDDHALNAAEWIVYDALYAYCQETVKRGQPNGQFAAS